MDRISGSAEWSYDHEPAKDFEKGATTSLSKNWRLIARGDYSYGDSDNDAWHFNAMADYRFNDGGSAFIGYRYMNIDFASGSYSYDAEEQGPMLGVSIYW
jgi:hypothetical protein